MFLTFGRSKSHHNPQINGSVPLAPPVSYYIHEMEAESSKQEKEGPDALITLMKSGGCEMDGGEGGGASNNDHYLGSTPHVQLMTITY